MTAPELSQRWQTNARGRPMPTPHRTQLVDQQLEDTPLYPELCIRIATLLIDIPFVQQYTRNLVSHSAGELSDLQRGSRPPLQARLDRREARDSAERSAPSSE